MPDPTRAIYVRMSDRLAHKLDSVASRLGASKRDILSALVDDHLDVDGDDLVVHPRRGPTGYVVAPEPEVLTVEDAASLLRVSASDVLALIDNGELPARRIGEQWRLTRTAVLDWLRGDGGPAVAAGP